jgi:hypothetical protein
MDVNVLLTALGSVIAVIAANIALISWMRSDMKSFEAKVSGDMKSFEGKISSDMKSFEIKIEGWKEEIYREMRDFHGRLCTIEERKRRDRD